MIPTGAVDHDQKWIAELSTEKNHDTQQSDIRGKPGANSYPA
jgi:hypothetical protein